MLPNFTEYALIFLGAYCIGLTFAVRNIGRDLGAMDKDIAGFLDLLEKELPAKQERKILRRLDELELRQDKQADAYTRLRGTVARLHRTDVRLPDEETAAAPAPSDETARLAYKEKLRDAARGKGLLR